MSGCSPDFSQTTMTVIGSPNRPEIDEQPDTITIKPHQDISYNEPDVYYPDAFDRQPINPLDVTDTLISTDIFIPYDIYLPDMCLIDDSFETDDVLGKDESIDMAEISGTDSSDDTYIPPSQATITPDEINFGVVTVGCYSKTLDICINNIGNATLILKQISFVDCDEFGLNLPPTNFPQNIIVGMSLCFGAVYVPSKESVEHCILKINTNDQFLPYQTIMLTGFGTYDAEYVDYFVQDSKQTTQFFLTRPADSSAIKVWVAENSCQNGWGYNGLSNSIIFDSKNKQDSCSLPKPDDEIKIWYKLLCFTE